MPLPCSTCGYDLTGTPDLLCPECGNVRRPQIGRRPLSSQQLIRWHAAALLAIFAPVLCAGLMFLLATVVLGRAPVASFDDPKQIPLVRHIYWAVWLSLYVIAAGVGLQIYISCRLSGGPRPRIFAHIGLCTFEWVAFALWTRIDPARILEWIAD